ncbi:hypothetical protein CLV29_2298 [Naumannella halotolerans]|uniref:Uncharacterized protein n=2 Tax=Naumannella halotolerans TaxID=993414 RepID=A0A4R7J179_9ACTN|nr:hypothetical protein CLV29_2298 [Naumannella halotolerans]
MTAQPITVHCPAWCTTDHRTQVTESHAGHQSTVTAVDSTLTVTTTLLPGDDAPLIEVSYSAGIGADQQTLVGLLTYGQAIELAAGLMRSTSEIGGAH